MIKISEDNTLLRCLTVVSSGQFSLLLPTLVVEAIFQASSPESNPNSLLPVMAISIPAVSTVWLDRTETR